jgi:hypothetical protein
MPPAKTTKRGKENVAPKAKKVVEEDPLADGFDGVYTSGLEVLTRDRDGYPGCPRTGQAQGEGRQAPKATEAASDGGTRG